MADEKKPLPTWDEAVKEFHGDKTKAALKYPELDPRYKADVEKYGEAKGIEKYSHDVVDPATGVDQGNIVQQIAENLPGSAGYAQQIGDLKSQGGLPGYLGDIGGALIGSASQLQQATTGKPMPENEGGPAPAGSTKPAAPAKPAATPTTGPTSPAAQAANSLMQSLAGEYTGAMASLAPYMGGQGGEAAAGAAAAMGQSIGGLGVQTQNPTYAAQLAGPQNQVAQAAAAGSKGIAQGITDMGTANEAYLQTAPYQGLLAALQSEGQYKVETGAAVPNVSGTPTWAQAAYADVLGAAPSGSGGVSAVGSQPQLAAQQAAQTTPTTTSQSVPGSAGGSG